MGWRGIFWVNVPVGLAALVLSALLVPESRAPRARGVDLVGQLLVITMLASLIYAIIEAPGAVSAKVISHPAGSGDVSPASEMGPAVRHDLGATWPGYVSIMVWPGRCRQPGWGGALAFSRQGCPRTDLDGPN